MRISALYILGLVIFGAAFSGSEASDQAFRIESWKKGSTKIQDQTLHIKLSAMKPDFEARIKDSSGNPRYKLSFTPERSGGSGSTIVAWHADLMDLRSDKPTNLLLRSTDPEQDFFTAKDRVWWLYPGQGAGVVPFRSKRIVAIEGFVCMIHVKRFQPARTKGGGLESITVDVEFKNEEGATRRKEGGAR